MPAPPLRVLILGGSSDATALARALAGRCGLEARLSLAGRTRAPAAQALPTRTGGFGGIEGLAAYLRAEAIALLVDATHPFAAGMSANARAAAALTGTPLLHVERPAWARQPGDLWEEVADMEAAVVALGDTPRRVFLTIGRQRLAAFAAAPQHQYLVRTIDPATAMCDLPQVRFIEARPPFDAEAEACLMRDHRVDVLVSKNSGGAEAYGKIAAARALGLPVILVRRPPPVGATMDVACALAAIEAELAARAHRAPLRRGV